MAGFIYFEAFYNCYPLTRKIYIKFCQTIRDIFLYLYASLIFVLVQFQSFFYQGKLLLGWQLQTHKNKMIKIIQTQWQIRIILIYFSYITHIHFFFIISQTYINFYNHLTYCPPNKPKIIPCLQHSNRNKNTQIFQQSFKLLSYPTWRNADYICFQKWDYYIQMSSRIKTHRRNQALEQGQQNFRFSIPVQSIDLARFSFQPKYDTPLTFRSSDISKMVVDTRLPKKQPKCKQISSSKTITSKTSSTLLSTFQNLQEKLAEAKKQFTVEKPKDDNSANFELNSFKQSSSGSGKWIDDSILEKLQESTINLQSQKKLINAVKSKERIIWAQKIKTYYLSQVVKGISGINERAFEHLTISLEILKNCMSLTLPNVAPQIKVQVPVLKENAGKKTLVIDLDETLFHCSQERNHPQDIEITLSFDDTHEKGYVSIRPYAISFLKRMRKHYEIIAFTASERSYADTILNQIDPEFELIQHRLYREHCVKLNNKIYAKDLRILGRDLSQVILVDNSPFSYLYQISNGVPILPYYSGDDSELLILQKYLQQARKAQDLRKFNRDTFKLHRYIEFDDCEELVKELYCSHY